MIPRVIVRELKCTCRIRRTCIIDKLERLLLDLRDRGALRRWRAALFDRVCAGVVVGTVATIGLVVAHFGRQRIAQEAQRRLMMNSQI